MIRFQVLGSVGLVGPDGLELRALLAQPKPLGLLAFLAMAPGAGYRRRDTIAAMLWPDQDQGHARGALRRTLHVLRSELGSAAIMVRGAEELGIDTTQLTTDVTSFDEAFSQKRWLDALTLYRGDFLAAFFLPGVAPDFEQWVDAERGRLHRAACLAAERQAEIEFAAGRTPAAAELARRALALAPDDEPQLRRLLRLLNELGDGAGAERAYLEFTGRIASEYGAKPSPETQALIASIRSRTVARARSSVEVTRTSRNVAEVAAGPAAAAIPPTESPTPTRVAAPGISHRSRMPARPALALVALALLTPMIIALISRRLPVVASGPTEQRIAVAPFELVGPDTTVGDLADGMVDLLAAELNSSEGTFVVDPGITRTAWEQLASRGGRDRTAASLELASRLSAGLVVSGTLIRAAGNQVVLRASLLRAGSGEVVSSASATGALDMLPQLAMRLASDLLAGLPGEHARLFAVGTEDLDALRAYLAGRGALRDGRFYEAYVSFDRACKADSNFLAASVGRLVAGYWTGAAWLVAGPAWRALDRLSPADRAIVIAVAGPDWPRIPSERQTLDAWERAIAVATAADRPEAWYGYADRLIRWGGAMDIPEWQDRAAAALRTALAIDPVFSVARERLVELAIITGDTSTIRHEGTRLLATPATPEDVAQLRWAIAAALRDTSELVRLRRGFDHLPPVILLGIGEAGQRDAFTLEDAERATVLFERSAASRRERQEAAFLRHDLALNEGRLHDAVQAMTDARRFDVEHAEPVMGGWLDDGDTPGTAQRTLIRDALYWGGDSVAAAVAANDLQRQLAVQAHDYASRVGQYNDACMVALWRAAQGERGGAASAMKLLQVPAGRDSLVGMQYRRKCLALLAAVLATGNRRSDALVAMRRLDSLQLEAMPPFDGLEFMNLALARMFASIGQPRDALRVLARDSRTVLYRSSRLAEEARLAAQVGDTARARHASSEYAALRFIRATQRDSTGATRGVASAMP